MFPDVSVVIRSLIVCWIDFPLFFARVVGARISISRCIRSHQNGEVVSVLLVDDAYVVDSPRIISASRLMK